MERAGAGVVAAVWEEWPALQAGSLHAVVLCGPGNNGGDGFVIARLLAEWGAVVWTFLYGDPDRLPPDAKVNHDRWAALGPVRQVAELSEIAPQVDALLDGAGGQVGPLLVVDALFGIGVTRPVPGFDVIGGEAWNDRFADRGVETFTVAVDVPSGLCADSGRVLGGGVLGTPLATDLTVTFHRAKPGHYLAEGPMNCGKLADRRYRSASRHPAGACSSATDRQRLAWAGTGAQAAGRTSSTTAMRWCCPALRARAARRGWRRGGRCGSARGW